MESLCFRAQSVRRPMYDKIPIYENRLLFVWILPMLRNMTEVCDGVVNSSPNLRQNVVSQFDFEKTSREIRRDSFALSVTVCVCVCGGRGGGI